VDHWIQWISEEVKAECLSTLTSSGGLAVVRSGGTRVVDLVLQDIGISEVGSVEEVVFRNPRYAKSQRDLDRQILGGSVPLIYGEGFASSDFGKRRKVASRTRKSQNLDALEGEFPGLDWRSDG
jgi:hypothetical protein